MEKRKYKRLHYEDRQTIEAMSKQGSSVKDIAEALGTHRDTIYREFKRCGATLETQRQQGSRHYKKGKIMKLEDALKQNPYDKTRGSKGAYIRYLRYTVDGWYSKKSEEIRKQIDWDKITKER